MSANAPSARPSHELTISEVGRRLRDGRLTATQLTRDLLTRIEAFDDEYSTFVLVARNRALEAAARLDEELAAGHDRGPLHGIPYALKDIFDVEGLPTTCHSHLRVGDLATSTSTVASRLEEAGSILLGKLASHEFALGGPSFDLPFPPARNPWNSEYFTGGSSSGSAAAVAAGFVGLTLGTDTSGSIRGPACYCGVVGLKPTFGRVSRRGVFPLSYSLDHCGVLAASVEDAAHGLQVIAGHDPGDPSSCSRPVPNFRARLDAGVEGVRVGYAREFMLASGDAHPNVVRCLDHAAQTLARLGAIVEEVELPAFELFEACGRIIMIAEAYAIHERDLRERASSYGRFTYQRMIIGATLSAADVIQASRLRRELTVELNQGPLASHDLLLVANGLGPAPRLSEFRADWAPKTSKQTIPFSVTGNPTLAMPMGVSDSGLPLGLQLVGRMYDEQTVLGVGATLEAALGVVIRPRTRRVPGPVVD